MSKDILFSHAIIEQVQNAVLNRVIINNATDVKQAILAQKILSIFNKNGVSTEKACKIMNDFLEEGICGGE
jgi:hypothetical protein